MNRLLIFLVFTCIFSCNKEPNIDYAVVSGKIENPKASNLIISGSETETELKVNEDGTFRDTLRFADNGFFDLIHGRENTTIYLKHGDDLKINLNTTEFDESLTYSGKGEVENNYLASKLLENENMLTNSIEFYSLSESEFLEKSESIRKNHQDKLVVLEGADEKFVATEKKNLVYDRYSLLNSYERNHKYFTKNPEYTVSDGFIPEELKNLNYDNEIDYHNSSAYRQMAFGKTLDKIFESIGDDYQSANSEDLKLISDIKIVPLKNDVINYLGGFLVSPGNPNMKEVHTFLISNTTDKDVSEKLNEKYNKLKNLTKGNPSPQFVKYENHKGGVSSLDDLKGKYVYVDVWATWCGPCIREIPSLKEVEKHFHGKNIEFVSTSIDVADKYDAWVAMVNDKELGGMQLMADNDWNSQFVKEYAIEGIPRFILIDPEGNIVSADAPRPSNPKLKEMLESLL